MNTKTVHGIVGYPVTPFLANGGAPDLPKLEALVDRLIASGAHAVAPLGSTGESAYLSDAEWEAVAEASIRRVAKRVPVIIGISELTTDKARRRAIFAEKAGADVVMVLPLSYWKLTEEEVFRHYASIAKSVSIPMMVYNNPATSGIDMSPELMVRMTREIDNVTMIKESTGDVQRMHRIVQLSEGRVPFFNGSNPLALEALVAGATGWCTAAACLIPQWNIKLYEAVVSGRLDEARQLFYRQLPLLEFIVKGRLPKTVKGGLELQGFDVGEPRKPVHPMDATTRQELKDILSALAE